jgi:hypothetical protein
MSDVYSVIGVVLITSSAFRYSDDDAVVAARDAARIARGAPRCGAASASDGDHRGIVDAAHARARDARRARRA